jgi:small subunit ribosomal protein S3Ae
MEEKKRVRAKGTWHGKEWCDIVAPPMFGGTKIGETPIADVRQLPGRVLETTLGDLIDDFSKSHIKLYFQVKEVEGNRALTKFIGHDMARDYVRSQIRRRTTKVDGIFDVTTQDGYRLRVTPMTTTFRRIQSSQINAIRSSMREVIESRGKKLTMDQFVQEIVLGKLAADIYKVIKKICPVRRVEVRKSKIISEPAKTVEEA